VTEEGDEVREAMCEAEAGMKMLVVWKVIR
jgi:hypothetical protein